MSNIVIPHRIFATTLFFILITMFIASIKITIPTVTWFPNPQVLIPIMTLICIIACIFLIIKPETKQIEIGILLSQSLITMWTGYETLGMFFYFSMIVILFGYGFFRKLFYRKTIILSFIWFIFILGIIPFGITRFLTVLLTFLFVITFNYAVYSHFKTLLAPLLPEQSLKAKIKLPSIGNKIYLTECGLSERQKLLLLDFINNNLTYKELADKYCISISTVKTDMAYILRIFGISNNNDLRIMLSQYKLI